MVAVTGWELVPFDEPRVVHQERLEPWPLAASGLLKPIPPLAGDSTWILCRGRRPGAPPRSLWKPAGRRTSSRVRPLHPVHRSPPPSQALPVIGAKAGRQGRGLAMFRWGFIPHWAADDKGMRPVNAKSETVASSVMFRDSFRERRCIVPADGFYEWRTENRTS